MRVHLLVMVYVMTGLSVAQTQDGAVIPRVTTVSIEEGAVTLLHLAPGYTTSIKLPEEISSVVVGNPAGFKAEHSDAEPRLVFLKPITSKPSESNALITTRSGHEITLHLVSAGQVAADPAIDFLVEYRRPQSVVVSSSDQQSFLIGETRPISQVASTSSPPLPQKPDLVGVELEKQKSLSSPAWEGKELFAALGASVRRDQRTVLAFSVLNRSNRTIELLPPQLELVGLAHGNKGKRIKADPVPITEYRITTRHLAPGERADGVVVFERPAFKESTEKLELQLAQAERVDRPILLPVQFTATAPGVSQ
jgi:hypothetical protein